jgi:hypothetical protein
MAGVIHVKYYEGEEHGRLVEDVHVPLVVERIVDDRVVACGELDYAVDYPVLSGVKFF